MAISSWGVVLEFACGIVVPLPGSTEAVVARGQGVVDSVAEYHFTVAK